METKETVKKTVKKSIFLALIMGLLIFSGAACYADPITVKTEKITSGSYYNGSYTTNCVAYARWLLSKLTDGKGILPSNLTSGVAKRNIINSSKAREKNVAIIDVKSGPYAQYDHVAVVVSVDDSGTNRSIVILESHYSSDGIFKRTIKGKNVSMSDLAKKANILGYWDYRK